MGKFLRPGEGAISTGDYEGVEFRVINLPHSFPLPRGFAEFLAACSLQDRPAAL